MQINAIQKNIKNDRPLKTKHIAYVEKSLDDCYKDGITYLNERHIYAGDDNFKPMLWAYMEGCTHK